MSQALLESTVGQLVVERPARARLFEKLGIDYCCGGKIPLGDALAKKGLAAETVLAELDAAPASTAESGERDWSTASMTDLCDHIEKTHHAYLREELPRVEFLTQKVANRHGERLPAMIEVHEVAVALKDELDSHMLKEERVLFPLCRKLDTAESLPESHCGSVDNPIAVMIAEHEDAGDALARLRELTDGFTPPADACNTYRAMIESLVALEADLHRHIHKENNILFPKAARIEKLLSR